MIIEAFITLNVMTIGQRKRMRGAGFNFQKGRIRLTCLDHSNGQITHELSSPIAIDPELALPELMDRYASHFRSLLDEHKPELVATRQIWDSNNVTAATCQIQPVGVLAYICNEKGIPFKAYTPQALRQPKPFGLLTCH